MEAPLAALTDQPLHLLSEEQLRELVQQVRCLRQSHQSFKASMLKEAQQEEAEQPKAKKVKPPSKVKALFDSLEADAIEDLFKSL